MNCRFYRQTELRWRASRLNEAIRLFPFNRSAKGAGTLRRAVRSEAFARILGGRHMECAYYFVDGTWNVPTYYFVDGT